MCAPSQLVKCIHQFVRCCTALVFYVQKTEGATMSQPEPRPLLIRCRFISFLYDYCSDQWAADSRCEYDFAATLNLLRHMSRHPILLVKAEICR
jgi:hypothetical protein